MFIFVVFHTAKTRVSPVDPGYFLVRFASAAHYQTGHSPIYIAIAAPDIWEWLPTCSALNPNLSSPMEQTVLLRAATISADVTCFIL